MSDPSGITCALGHVNKSIKWKWRRFEVIEAPGWVCEWMCMCACARASLLSICRTSRGWGAFRGNDLTNIRKAPAVSWCPCRDVWLEALERLTLSFCLSRAIVLICEGGARRVGLPPEFPPELLTAISLSDFKSLGRVAVYQERRITDRGHARFSHTCARERETIGTFDFPGQLMLLW